MQVVKGHEGAGATRKRGLRALPGKIRRAPAFLVKLAHMARFAAQAWKLSRRVAPFQIFDAADCAAELAGAGLPWPGTDTQLAEAATGEASSLLAVIRLLQDQPALRQRFPRALSQGLEGGFARWLLESPESPWPIQARATLRAAWLDRPSLAARRLWQHLDHLRTLLPAGLLPPWRRSLIRWMVGTARPAHGTPLPSILWFLAELAEDPAKGLDELWLDSPAWQARWPRAQEDPAQRQAFFAYAARIPAMAPHVQQVRQANPPGFPMEKGEPAGVNLYGHFCYPSGLGEAAWQIRRGLEAAGVSIAPRDMPAAIQHDLHDRNGMRGPEIHPLSIHVLPPEHQFHEIFQRSMSHPRPDARRAAVWYWELEKTPALWAQRARSYDEIWAPTRFIRDSFAQVMPVPVRAVAPGVSLGPVAQRDRAHFGLPQSAFVVLFAFDMCSVMERKNPLGLVRAFRQAFRAGDDALLVIKVTRGAFDPDGLALLKAEEAQGRVLLIDRVMSRADAMALIHCCDTYASLHRSEGFGLTLAEAMLLGKPVVGTHYSGNLDFMTPEVSRLVACKKVIIGQNLPQYPQGSAWAQPDEEHAASLLRGLYEHPAAARALGEAGQLHAQRVLDPQAATQRLLAALTALGQKQTGKRVA